MYDNITPSVIALHGSLVELTMRLNRVERKLGVEPAPLLTFGQAGSVPLPPDVEPCSCDEAVALRTRVRELTAALARTGRHER